MSQRVAIWGVFPNQTAAGEALNLLESGGFRQGQIAIEKRFKSALAGFDWSQAIYVRLPEGIVAGFVGGAFLSALIAMVVSRGIPPVVPAACFMCIGSVVGTILGAFGGMLVAKYESSTTTEDSPKGNDISIGVLCFDHEAEDRAKTAFQKAGAASIDTAA